jgi:DNA invertase Pin-like site-specific DNA recombinase
MTIVAYARTSTLEQIAGLEAQIRDLTAAGADRVVSEQASGTDADRPFLKECLDSLVSGDVLMVTKPDRLARSTAHLLTILEDLTARGIGMVLLSMGGERFDTRNPTSKLMLTILAGVATWEREIMLERQREGIAKAQAEGKYRGGKIRIDRDAAVSEAARCGPEEAARRLGCSASSIYGILAARKVLEAA